MPGSCVKLGWDERPRRHTAGARAPRLPFPVAGAVLERDRRQHRARRARAVRIRADRQRDRPGARARRPCVVAGRVPARRRRLGRSPAAPPRDDRDRSRALHAARAARRPDPLRGGTHLAGGPDRGALRRCRGVLPSRRRRAAPADGPRAGHPAGDSPDHHVQQRLRIRGAGAGHRSGAGRGRRLGVRARRGHLPGERGAADPRAGQATRDDAAHHSGRRRRGAPSKRVGLGARGLARGALPTVGMGDARLLRRCAALRSCALVRARGDGRARAVRARSTAWSRPRSASARSSAR
jgi:hypothetical protein